jgi:putative endonuclease
VVEHLLAKEDVASSTLVTRSSPESFRGWSERAVALAEADRPNLQATAGRPARVMHYVYLLKSKSSPTKQYIGSTRDLRQRRKAHNESRSTHTAKFRPRVLTACFSFAEEKTAAAFERYLKSGLGRAFVNRHFV